MLCSKTLERKVIMLLTIQGSLNKLINLIPNYEKEWPEYNSDSRRGQGTESMALQAYVGCDYVSLYQVVECVYGKDKMVSS